MSSSTAAHAPAAFCRIVQRGAVPPLINMLSHKDAQLKEMAAFALGRLAQAVDNQAGIVQASMLQSALHLCRIVLGTFALAQAADKQNQGLFRHVLYAAAALR